MQTIKTKYISATNAKGSRIKATTSGGISVTVGVDNSLSGAAVHFEAVKKLCAKLNWKGELIEGSTKEGHVFTFVKNSETFSI